MSAAAGTAPPGWFGKLSMLGDFAHRRLSPDVVQRLDAWLAGWVVDSRRRLGDDRWRAAYLSAPVLRFAWAPGVLGPTAWLGVLMPSCDSAGRYFPLWVGEACGGGINDVVARRAWFDAVEAAATATLDDGASLNAFERLLGDAGEKRSSSAARDASSPTAGTAMLLSRWWVGSSHHGDSSTALHWAPDVDAITSLLIERSQQINWR